MTIPYHKRSSRLRQGAWIALAVVVALLLIPPMLAEKLDAWDAATGLLDKDPRLIAQCGDDVRVDLSPWFYTYKFSGDYAQARFRGRALSNSCDRSLTVEVQRTAGKWQVVNLSL